MKLTTLCYIEKDDKILFLYRNKKKNDVHRGKYIGLGGKLEPGESPDECIIREVKEESGLEIKHPVLRGIMTFPMFDGVEDWYTFLYSAHEFAGEISESDEGELYWVEKSDIERLDLWEGDRIFLDWMKNNEFFSAKFIYKDGKLQEYSVNIQRQRV